MSMQIQDTPTRGVWPTVDAVAATWALLVGVSLLMFANGMQSTLLGVRSEMEGYQTFVTGIIMTGYYVGFLAGSMMAPRIIGDVGYVRVFAALASSASVAVLVHGILVDPITWMAMRFVTGFSFAGLYIVAESWLNGRTDNVTRGKLLSIYMIVQMGSLSAGQLSISLGDPGALMLFIAASIAVSIGLIPILLSRSPAPEIDVTAERLSLTELYRISPFGLTTAGAAGLLYGAYTGMGAVYATQSGLSLFNVALFGSLMMAGGALLQFPVGSLSDRLDRRHVIIGCAFAAFFASVVGALSGASNVTLLMATALVFGGFSMPLYSLALAYTNDYVPRSQVISASAGLVMVYGVMSIFGPLAASFVMQALGPSGFFWYMAVLMAALGVFGVIRMTVRPSLPADEQLPYVPALSRASPLSTDVMEETYEEAEEAAEAAEAEQAAGATSGSDNA